MKKAGKEQKRNETREPNVTEFDIKQDGIGEKLVLQGTCGCGHKSRIRYKEIFEVLACMDVGGEFAFPCGNCADKGRNDEYFFIVLKTGPTSFKLIAPHNLKITGPGIRKRKPKIAGKK